MARPPYYPLGTKGEVRGRPYQGSHTMYHNWQSDNAVDLAVAFGTPVYAVSKGVIGPNIGYFDTNDPHLEGQRLTIEGGKNSFYYAHLSKIIVRPGQNVKPGQLLGYSGRANGLDHLHFAMQKGDPVAFVATGVVSEASSPDTSGVQPPAATTPSTDTGERDPKLIPDVSVAPTVPTVEPPLAGEPRYDLGGYQPHELARVADTWRMIAQGGVSPDTHRFSALSQTTHGDGNAEA